MGRSGDKDKARNGETVNRRHGDTDERRRATRGLGDTGTQIKREAENQPVPNSSFTLLTAEAASGA
jgi:hypothetical protein